MADDPFRFWSFFDEVWKTLLLVGLVDPKGVRPGKQAIMAEYESSKSEKSLPGYCEDG